MEGSRDPWRDPGIHGILGGSSQLGYVVNLPMVGSKSPKDPVGLDPGPKWPGFPWLINGVLQTTY